MRKVEGMDSTWPEGGGFHAADGLFFTRGPDGSVTVRRYSAHDEGAEPDFAVTLTSEQWASIVASVSAGGENYVRWKAALDFHVGGAS